MKFHTLPLLLMALCTALAHIPETPFGEKPHPKAALTYNTAAEASHMAARYAQYNEWANRAMAEWLATGSEAAMQMEIESSFKDLRSTALHIWSAEYLWLQVLKDEPYDQNPTKDFQGDTKALIEGWLEASGNFTAYVAQLNEAALRDTRGGGDGRAPLRVDDIIQHCMNHSTYHRGQLITMGRQAGLDKPPRTDFIYFASTVGK